jgi:hypothetical protein
VPLDRRLPLTAEVLAVTCAAAAFALFRHLELVVFGLSGITPGADWFWDAILNGTNMLRWGENLWAGAPVTEGLTYWPARDTLALTEQIPLYAALMPALTAMVGDVLGAHNVLVLLSTALSAGAFYALLRRMGLQPLPALLGALLMGLHPFGTRQAARVQLLCTFPIAVAFIGVLDAADGRRRGPGVVAFGVLLAAATCVYYLGLLLGLLLVVTSVIAFHRRHERQALAGLGRGLVGAGVGLLPGMLWLRFHLEHNQRLGVKRTWEELVQHVLPLEALFESPGLAFWGPATRLRKPDIAAFPGGVALALITACLLVLLLQWVLEHYDGERVRLPLGGLATWAGLFLAVALGLTFDTIVPAVVVAVAAAATAPSFGPAAARPLLVAGLATLALSLGPHLAVGDGTLEAPFGFLYRHLPAVAAIRAAPRYAHLAMLLFAWWALVVLFASSSGRGQQLVAGALCVVALVDLTPAPALPVVVPAPDALESVRWLRAHDDGGAVLHLPVRRDGKTEAWPELGTVVGHDVSVLHRYRAFTHGHPIINGHSGMDPPLFEELLVPDLKGFPHVRGLKVLERLGVRYILADRGTLERERYDALRPFVEAHPDRLQVVLEARGELLLELRAPAPPPAVADLTPLPPRASVPPSCAVFANGRRTTLLTDGDLRTREAARSGRLVIDIFCQIPLFTRGVHLSVAPLTGFPDLAALSCPLPNGVGRYAPVTTATLRDLPRLAFEPAARTLALTSGPLASHSYRVELGSPGSPTVFLGEIGLVPLPEGASPSLLCRRWPPGSPGG